jgi:hypothetical protein
MVAHDEVNGQCKLWSLMKHDELADMGWLVTMR